MFLSFLDQSISFVVANDTFIQEQLQKLWIHQDGKIMIEDFCDSAHFKNILKI